MKLLNKLRKNRRGVINVILGAIVAAIIAGILVMIAAEINVNVYNSMPAVTGAANTTIGNMYTATFGGLQLMTVLPVVLASFVLIHTKPRCLSHNCGCCWWLHVLSWSWSVS
jgi:riboflavin transporter FmnP